MRRRGRGRRRSARRRRPTALLPGAGADERHRVEAETPGWGPRGRGRQGGASPSSIPRSGRSRARPGPVPGRQKFLAAAHSCQAVRRNVDERLRHGRRRRASSRCGSAGDEARAGSGLARCGSPPPAPASPCRNANADPDLPARLVQAMGVAPDDRRQRRHPGGAEESRPSGRGAEPFGALRARLRASGFATCATNNRPALLAQVLLQVVRAAAGLAGRARSPSSRRTAARRARRRSSRPARRLT